MSAIQDHVPSTATFPVIQPPPETPPNTPMVPPAPRHQRTRSVLDAAQGNNGFGIPLDQRDVTVFTIVEEPQLTVELVATNDSTTTSSSAAGGFFKHLQNAEDLLDKGRAALKTLQELGAKGDFVAALTGGLDQLKDLIDRAQVLKQKIDAGDIVETAMAVDALRQELAESIEPFRALLDKAQEMAAEMKSCCSSLLSCFRKKS